MWNSGSGAVAALLMAGFSCFFAHGLGQSRALPPFFFGHETAGTSSATIIEKILKINLLRIRKPRHLHV